MSRRVRPPLSSLVGQSDFNTTGMAKNSQAQRAPIPPSPSDQHQHQQIPKSLHTYSTHPSSHDRYDEDDDDDDDGMGPSSPMSQDADPYSRHGAHFQQQSSSQHNQAHHSPVKQRTSSAAHQSSRTTSLFVQNTTSRDRRILAKREFILQQLERHPLHPNPYFWRSPFIHKEKRIRLLLIHHPSVYPVLSRHLAARMIQHWWHRFPDEQRRQRSMRKQQLALERDLDWIHPYDVWIDVASHAARIPTKRKPTLQAAYYLETGQYATQLGTSHSRGSLHSAGGSNSGSSSSLTSTSKSYTPGYRNWCSSKIARAWFYHRTFHRYRTYTMRPVYTYAAIDIQRCWREYRRKKSYHNEDSTLRLHRPASVIQRAYRRFTQRRIYQYFRDLIMSRQNSNPYLLLKMLQPHEALTANDHASGLYIRFRLGGNVFPPILYYKTFTNLNITDIGAFAPRDYARDRKMELEARHIRSDGSTSNHGIDVNTNPTDRAYWYKRYENNGWRPIVNDSILATRDVVHERTSEKKMVFHPNKIVRRMEVLKRRKEKKIEWLKKLYTSGVVQLPNQQQQSSTKSSYEEKATNSVDLGSNRDLDSDEEEWEAWKIASSSRLPTANGTTHAHAANLSQSKSPEELLATLQSLDTTNTRALLTNVGEWEDEADELLQWTNDLVSFESYHDNWLVTATSRPNDKEYRIHDATYGVTNLNLKNSTTSRSKTAAPSAVGLPSSHTVAPSSNLSGSNSILSLHSSPTSTNFGIYPHATGMDGGIGMSMDSALAAAAAAAAVDDDNAGLPDWIAQTSSRAQLAAFQASQQSLESIQDPSHRPSTDTLHHPSLAATRKLLPSASQSGSTTSFGSSSIIYEVPQVRLTPATSQGGMESQQTSRHRLRG